MTTLAAAERPRARVLVVDDNEDHRALMERALRPSGADVRSVPSAEAALGELHDVDLVVVDYRLPGMTGGELLARIRDRGGPSVIVVTGMGSEDIAVEALRAGAVDYLVKRPGYLSDLPKVVERAWRTHDLAHRAGELQRLTFVVTSASDRAAVCTEVAAGARALLRADGCVLYALEGGRLVAEATAGVVQRAGDVAIDAARVAHAPSNDVVVDGPTTALLVPVHAPQGDTVGVLVMTTADPRLYLAEEVRLAQTLASFAGIALANVNRLQIEQALVRELESMLDLRRNVVAAVSHELRTPLTCVNGFADTLLSHWDAIDDEQRRRFVGKIRRHGDDLHDLVERLLDFARLEAGRVEAQCAPIKLNDEVAATVDKLAPMLGDRPVEVAVDDVEVLGDAALVQRALTNLLSNAVKYSPPGAPVIVRSVVDGSMVRLEVVDRGEGLDESAASHVFEPFWRATDAGYRRGTGIGLALVREYARVMGGQVSVDSAPGEGSTFVLALQRC